MEKKYCPKCSVEKELDSFGGDVSRLDGLQVWCLVCRRDYQRMRRRLRLDVEDHRAKYRQNPEMYKSHVYVAAALRRGTLRKPDRCSLCQGRGLKLEGHHPNGYDQVNRLDLIWLCRSCHHLGHKRPVLRTRLLGAMSH